MKKHLKYFFGLFSFGLTLISMQSGFYFYKILFGLSTAILATGVFEILRLATLLYLSLNLETKKKVVALCDANNFTFHIDKIIPCNNKSNKSLGFILYLLTRELLKARREKKKIPKIEDFIGEEEWKEFLIFSSEKFK